MNILITSEKFLSELEYYIEKNIKPNRNTDLYWIEILNGIKILNWSKYQMKYKYN